MFQSEFLNVAIIAFFVKYILLEIAVNLVEINLPFLYLLTNMDWLKMLFNILNNMLYHETTGFRTNVLKTYGS